MRVKGTAYLARLVLLREKLTEEGAVERFVEDYARTNPEFRTHIIPTSQIPAEAFLKFIDHIVAEVYGGDTHSLWELGRRSADWTLKQGPYRSLLELRDIPRFAAMAPVMWSNFFDKGSARSVTEADHIDLWIEDVPADLRHPYFEFSVVGYFQRGLELLGTDVQTERIAGFSAGDAVTHYRLTRLTRLTR